MKLILQPSGSSICGQCCVSMVTNTPLERVVAYLGKGATSWPDLHDAIWTLSNIMPRKLQRVSNKTALPHRAILIVHWSDHSHWVIKDGERILDPAGQLTRMGQFNKHLPRVTSYSEII